MAGPIIVVKKCPECGKSFSERKQADHYCGCCQSCCECTAVGLEEFEGP